MCEKFENEDQVCDGFFDASICEEVDEATPEPETEEAYEA